VDRISTVQIVQNLKWDIVAAQKKLGHWYESYRRHSSKRVESLYELPYNETKAMKSRVHMEIW